VTHPVGSAAPSPFRVVTLGELLLRLSPPPHELLFQSPQFRWFFGGSEANVAASLARFGVASEFVTRLPANAVGDAALATLRAEGVSTQHIARGGNRLGIYFVESGADVRQMRVVYDRAGSAFSEMQTGSISWEAVLRGADRLHVSGITPALSEATAAITTDALAAARRIGVRVSIDLNFRPAIWSGMDPRPVIRPLASQCDLIIGNLTAIAAMLGIASEPTERGDASVRTIATRVQAETGCSTIAITRRDLVSATQHGWSAILFDGATQELYSSRAYEVAVVDRVGGGDAFAAGLIYALLNGESRQHAIDFAAAAGALKLTVPGDFNRVSKEDVLALLGSDTHD
jgi:2-dehydro-3-deoxygluconokinase